MLKEIDFKFNNINIKLLQTKQYKTVTGIISFVRPLDEKDFTYYSLLNRLIGSSSKNYPSKESLSNKLFELYDCSAYMTTSYSYKSANTMFVFQTINNKLVSDENDIIKGCIDILKEIMFNPLLEEDKLEFDYKNFNEEVKALENDIKNIYNNKKKYAFRKLMEAMAPNDIISVSTLGNLDVLKTITPKSLYDFYVNIFNDSFINIGVIGDITEEEIKSYFDDLKLNSKHYDVELYPKFVNFKDTVLQVNEKQDIVQAKLLIAFRYDIGYNEKNYIPLIVFNAMFGGMFGSSLFMNIRENHSLTYDIGSELMINKKMLLVSCGVDNKNVEITSDLIIKELESYKQGNIDSNILKVAKEFLINDLKEMQDYQFSILSYKLENIISKRPSVEEIINKINLITIDDIIEVSNMIKLDTIFTLTSGDEYE